MAECVTGNRYNFYRYNDIDRTVENIVSKYFAKYVPTEGLFFYHSNNVDEGSMRDTTTEIWGAYTFDGRAFTQEYLMAKVTERGHYSFAPEVTTYIKDTYMKDGELISESEYNRYANKMEAAEGLKTYEYSEENINTVLYNNNRMP